MKEVWYVRYQSPLHHQGISRFRCAAWIGFSHSRRTQPAPPIGPNDSIKVTKLETFFLRNSWVFVKISTDAGMTGWGEMLKDDAKACAAGAQEVGRYLVGWFLTPGTFRSGPPFAKLGMRHRESALSRAKVGSQNWNAMGGGRRQPTNARDFRTEIGTLGGTSRPQIEPAVHLASCPTWG
jgi:hypothetical protein